MLKKVSSIVLTIMMLISMLCTITVASAAPAPQLVLTVDDTDGRVERGQTVTVTVAMSEAMNMSSVLVKLPFNENLFKDTYAATGLIEVGYADHNVDDGKLHLIWGHEADVAATELFQITLTVKEDAAFGFYDIEGAIEEISYGALRETYVAGTDYVKAAERLAVEVYCEHAEAYTQPTGNPAKADAKHGVYCSKCGETFGDEACSFSAPVEVDKDTCTKEGKTKITCSVCQYFIESKVDEITEHNWSTEWKPVETQGSTQHYRECLNGCGIKDYAECGNWVWNNVSAKNGSKHVCGTCNREQDCTWQELVEKTQATCTEDAYTLYPCIKCSGSYKIVEAGTATGHTLKPNADGKTHSCANCTLIKNVPCNFNKTIQEGDCITDTIKQCECGGRKVTEKAPGVHPQDKVVIRYKEPSIGYSGYKKFYCNDCSSEWDNKKLARGKQFNDIDKKNPACWYYKTAVFAKSFNLMGGDGEGNFDGDGKLTRGMVVTILGRYLWEDNAVEKMTDAEFKALLNGLGGETVKFNDLTGSWYDRYAVALSAIGVVKGSYGSFNGEDEVTREELATFFIRYIDYIAPGSNEKYIENPKKLSDITDMNKVSSWAKAFAERSVLTGLFAGDNYGRFNPQGTATRAEMATIMERVVRAHSAYPIVDVE